MYVDLRNGAAAVHDAADLKSLSVRTANPADLVPGIHGLGEPAPDGGHVWLHIERLKAAAAATVAADQRDEWAAGFDSMIAYARAKGWASADGTSVRAHIETLTT